MPVDLNLIVAAARQRADEGQLLRIGKTLSYHAELSDRKEASKLKCKREKRQSLQVF